MKVFIDTANINEIKKYSDMGLIDGVTTNPALVAREGGDFKNTINEICDLVDGPISAEVVSTNTKEMVMEAKLISKLHKNIIVKLPAIPNGFEALKECTKEGIRTNFTLVYTSTQALMAAKLGATFVSPFIGRMEATSTNGSKLIEDIAKIYKNYRFSTEILAASMRNVIYVREAALAGAHAATIPPEVLKDMLWSELSNSALEGFLEEWNSVPDDKKNYFTN
tara:strand:+ start:10285 stop:10953 length:669 start_codon:yes stop_codon:yes gene_type:complete